MRNVDFSTKVFRLLMLVLLLFSVQISHADGGWPKTVKGRIVDAKSGETLIGVNIQIKELLQVRFLILMEGFS
ncbi:hypothetical protein SFC43_24110 [Bacteroides sp. CR5/BHMF/2]|nr:hypothetical protein [Bacteroides sp. CR5/BHMF/2]